jgi:hypothetical protein
LQLNSRGQLLGSQVPRVRTVPEYDSSAGEEVIELAESAGLLLDPWQQSAVMDICAEDDYGQWASFEVALLVARQNGKGSIIEALELGALFIWGDNLIIHTAHEFKTAAEGYLRIKMLIENNYSLSKKVKQYHGSHGEEGITLKNGKRLKFIARTKAAGRGFTCDRLFYDEAYELAPSSIAASLPTMSARPNPQVIYTSSAPLDTSLALKKIMNRGHKKPGFDYASLAYIEYSADPKGYDVDSLGNKLGLDLDDRRGWVDANPGMGRRLSESFTIKERAALGDVEFARERLGVPDEPSINAIFKPEKWEHLRDALSQPRNPVSFAVDTNPEGTWTSITASSIRRDGRVHVELVDRRRGINWAGSRLAELKEDWEPSRIVMDAMSPATVLIPQLKTMGIKKWTPDEDNDGILIVTNTTQFGRACVAFFNLFEDDRLVHIGQPDLTSASEVVTTRDIGEAGLYAWARKDSTDIAPFVAATLSTFGLLDGAGDEKKQEVDKTVLVLRR